MIAFLLPLAALAFVLSLPRRRDASTYNAAMAWLDSPEGKRQLAHASQPHVGFAPSFQTQRHTASPTPLGQTLELLRLHQPIPPVLAQWAIAEANALGRYDVAAALYQRFVAPYLLQPSAPASQGNPADGSFSPSAQLAASAPAPVAAPSPSPIKGIDDAAWQALTAKLSRGESTFASQKRVGRYHQSRTRLRELGLDPDSLIGNAAVQDSALAADLVDGFQKARAKGLLGAIGQPSPVLPPSVDPAAAPPVSLSGLLGILSVAGVDGLAGWLSSPEDRQRFPYTTNLFLQTNGMF